MRTTRRCWALWLAGLLVAAAPPTTAGGSRAIGAAVMLGRWQSRPVTREDYRGKTVRTREAVFDMGTIPYRIRYTAAFDEAEPGTAIPIEGYIGMPGPSSENWYHSGFLWIIVNGQDIGHMALSSMTVSESGERAMLDMVWHHPTASVRARFVGLPGDEALYVEIALEPRQEIRSVTVQTRCYPSFFTSWHKRQGARRIKTPGAVVGEGVKRTVPAADNWWMAFYDEVFDVAKGEGVGPCAMMVLPEEAAEIALDPGGYAVTARVTYPPDRRRIRMAFWDYTGWTDAAMLGRVPAVAADARDRLRRIDLTPAVVQSFDFDAAQTQVQRALASGTIRSELGGEVKQMQAWLDGAAPAVSGKTDAPAVLAQERLLQRIGAFNEFVWQMRLAELLYF